MAKKKKSLNYIVVGALALLFGIAAFCMMFLTAITFKSGDTVTDGYTGAQLAFGYSEDIPLFGEFKVLGFNFVALLAFALPLVGGVVALITKNGLISKIISVACFVAGAVLLFSIVGYSGLGRATSENSIVQAFLDELYKAIDSTKGLGIGAILGAIFSIIGAVICFFKGTIAKFCSRFV